MTPTPSPQVELYVRSLASRTGQQERIIERLHRLESAGVVESADVQVWGEAVELSTVAAETERGQELLETVSRFRDWAARNGASLDGPFLNRETESLLTGRSHTTLRLPAVAMAEYEGEEIRAVTPHRRDGTVRTVQERVETLATETDRAASSDAIRH